MFISEGWAGQIQSQFTDHLLCHSCEQRFSDHGEAWVVGNCYRGERRFSIQNNLLQSAPVQQVKNSDITVYSALSVPKIDVGKLEYFALSVVWRAAVNDWYIPEVPSPIGLDLGPYENPMREYLLGSAGFPLSVALTIRIASPTAPEPRGVMYPAYSLQNGWHAHRFVIPGIDFVLHVGSKIPESVLQLSFAPNPKRFILVSPEMDEQSIDFASQKMVNARKRHPA